MAKHMRLVTAVAASLAFAAPVWAEGETAATVVATVNGTEITLGQMIALGENLPPEYQSLPEETLYNAVLEQLIQQEVLAQTIANTTTRDEANLKNDRLNYLAGIAMRKALENGVSDEEVQTIYDELMKDVPLVTEYKAAHILVEDEAKANDLKKLLDEGSVFADLAKANSNDPGSAVNGGDLGWFDPGMMVKPFADAVVAAELGQIVGPIKSDFGYHLILVDEKRETKRPTLDEARNDVKAEAERRKVTEAIDKLSAEAKIEKPGAELAPALIKNTQLID